MDEESEVIDLKDEVSSEQEPAEEMAHDIEGFDLDIPAFRVPDESDHEAQESLRRSGSFVAATRGEVPSAGIIAHRRTGAFKQLNQTPTEPVEKASSEPADYDRQAMVKTMQMQAVSPADFEQYLKSKTSEARELAFLSDQRFAPELIVLPPRVLIKRWQEGAPSIGLESFHRHERPVTVPSLPSIARKPAEAVSTDTMSSVELEVEPEEAVRPHSAFQTMRLDALEIETLDEEPQQQQQVRRPPPLTQQVTQQAQATQQQQQQQQARASQQHPPAQRAPQPRQQAQAVQSQVAVAEKPQTASDSDPEMSGLIQELLEEQKAAQKKERPKRLRPRDVWFQEAFGEEYFRTLPPDLERQTLRDTDFITQSLNLKRGARILDVACGFGRHAVELSSRGYEMVGLDLSMPMLQRALNESQARGQSIKYLHGDMRELAFQDAFDGCYIWQTSFGYFDDRTNLKVMQGVHRALKTGGRFLIDVVNRDYVLGQMPSRTWWEGSSCIFLEEAEFDYNASVLYAKRSFIYEDGTPPLEQTSFVRLYSLHELRQMLNLSGFSVLEVSGELHHRGHFLGASSGRLLVLAEKRKPKG